MNRKKYPDGYRPQRCTSCRRKFDPSELVKFRKRFWCGDCLTEDDPEYLASERERHFSRRPSFDFECCPATGKNQSDGRLDPVVVSAAMRRLGVPMKSRREMMTVEFQASKAEKLSTMHAWPER